MTESADTIQSVAMALQVLEKLAHANGDVGVTALATALDTTKSRIHRHLRTLIALGYVSQSEQTERYRIGARLIALGRAASASADFTSVALPHMRRLRDRTGQAVSLGQIEPNGIRIIDTLGGNLQIEVGVRPGTLLGFFTSAQGKAAMAAMSAEKRKALIPRTIPKATDYSITDPRAFNAHLDEIAARGWATAPNETMLGLNALASTVFNADREPVATIAIVSLIQHIATPPEPTQIEAVQEAASAISAELGYSPL